MCVCVRMFVCVCGSACVCIASRKNWFPLGCSGVWQNQINIVNNCCALPNAMLMHALSRLFELIVFFPIVGCVSQRFSVVCVIVCVCVCVCLCVVWYHYVCVVLYP